MWRGGVQMASRIERCTSLSNASRVREIAQGTGGAVRGWRGAAEGSAEVVRAGAAVARQRVHHDDVGPADAVDERAVDLEGGAVALDRLFGEAFLLDARGVDDVCVAQARQRIAQLDDVAVAADAVDDGGRHL